LAANDLPRTANETSTAYHNVASNPANPDARANFHG
jgi:hypothetical protein